MSKRKDKLSDAVPSLWHILKGLSPYLAGHRMMLGGSVAALFGATAMKLLEPWPLKFVIDRVVPSTAGPAAGLAALPPTTLLAICAAGLLLVVALKALFQYLSTVGFALVGNRVLTRVRNDLFRHLQSLSLRFHQNSRSGDLTMRLIGDVGMLKETAVTAALPLAANLLVLVGMIGVMLALNWQLALLALAPLPLLWLCSVRLSRKITEVSRKQRARQGDLASTSSEALAGIRAVQALGIEERAARAFDGASSIDMREGVKGKRLAAALERSVDLLTGLGLAIVLWFGTLQVLDGRLSPGDLLVFITYLKNTFRPVREYAKYSARLAKAAAAGERVVSLLDTAPEIQDRPNAGAVTFAEGAVRFEGVTFGYDSAAQPVLNDLSLSIQPGCFVALTGPSGTGKSTLMSLLLRLYDPDAGRVLIDGEDVRDVSFKSLRSQIGLVPQETPIFKGSLAENIALGAGREVTREEIEAAARMANAHQFITAFPDGYDTEVAERGTSLSAGQRQRIAVARAALRQSRIQVFDEPTVGLDRINEAAVADALCRLARGRTTFLITHDLDLAARADRIVYLEGGRVVQEGTHTDLLKRGGGYSDLWHRQAAADKAAS